MPSLAEGWGHGSQGASAEDCPLLTCADEGMNFSASCATLEG